MDKEGKKKVPREGQNPIFSPKHLDLEGRVESFCGFVLRYYGCRSLRDFFPDIECLQVHGHSSPVLPVATQPPEKARGIGYI